MLGRPPPRQADRHRARRRSLPRDPPDDRRPLALARRADRSRRHASRSRCSSFPTGTLVLTEAGTKRRASLHVVRGDGGARGIRSRAASKCSTPTRATFAARLARREPHAEARADRSRASSAASATRTRTRSCIARELSPLAHDAKARRRGDSRGCSTRRATCSREWTARLRAEAGGEFPGEGHRVSAGDGRARQVPAALPGVRHAGAAHRLRRQRDATTARAARPAASCSPTARCRGCCTRAGRARNLNDAFGNAPGDAGIVAARDAPACTFAASHAPCSVQFMRSFPCRHSTSFRKSIRSKCATRSTRPTRSSARASTSRAPTPASSTTARR